MNGGIQQHTANAWLHISTMSVPAKSILQRSLVECFIESKCDLFICELSHGEPDIGAIVA